MGIDVGPARFSQQVNSSSVGKGGGPDPHDGPILHSTGRETRLRPGLQIQSGVKSSGTVFHEIAGQITGGQIQGPAEFDIRCVRFCRPDRYHPGHQPDAGTGQQGANSSISISGPWHCGQTSVSPVKPQCTLTSFGRQGSFVHVPCLQEGTDFPHSFRNIPERPVRITSTSTRGPMSGGIHGREHQPLG